ncbi:hypothetical protein [Acaryochloris sp. IP29b_bin.137]|uniref:hypothetical protein n=1 Tax=Acaryochloris sp. IP29b_bin.137 TaxID=2969217 RepID=UPI00262E19B7|nr:hypothetical protein [Acaryochloris sp. IP29b_bin.137]
MRRNGERYGHELLLLKQLVILKHKRYQCKNYLKYKDGSIYSALLDRSMRFWDKKMMVSGQYRVAEAIDPMMNAWALISL